VVVNPEFLTEGTAVTDFLRPDRIVVGSDDEVSAKQVANLYLTGSDVPILVSSPGTAEMIKYASNALLATLISFSNEIANLSRRIDNVDAVDVMRGVHASRYLTDEGGKVAPIVSFLEAGCGFGGSCLPKDTRALVQVGKHFGQHLRLLSAVDGVNRAQANEVLDILIEEIGELEGRKIGILGLAFKPDTDDVRESPAFRIIELLHERGALVLAHDPKAIDNAMHSAPGAARIRFTEDLKELLREVEAAILITKWDFYLDVASLMDELESPPLFIDSRRMFSPSVFSRYAGIGRKN
jgi:UDPglucose 6-dehydrogenase/GDP-mannose 6-dehydrogenase